MNSNQFRRYLAKLGATFEPGGGGHLLVKLRGRISVLPQHGGRKQLKKGLMKGIKKDLGIK